MRPEPQWLCHKGRAAEVEEAKYASKEAEGAATMAAERALAKAEARKADLERERGEEKRPRQA